MKGLLSLLRIVAFLSILGLLTIRVDAALSSTADCTSLGGSSYNGDTCFVYFGTTQTYVQAVSQCQGVDSDGTLPISTLPIFTIVFFCFASVHIYRLYIHSHSLFFLPRSNTNTQPCTTYSSLGRRRRSRHFCRFWSECVDRLVRQGF